MTVDSQLNRQPVTSFTARVARALLLCLAFGAFAGCEVDSLFDASKAGYYEHTPTTTPILNRIDVIERQGEIFGETSSPRPEDLLPSKLTYHLSPGDVLTVQIFELVFDRQPMQQTSRVDASGNFRIAQLGDVRAAGRTVGEFEDAIIRKVREDIMSPDASPMVTVSVDSGDFQYTVYGAVPGSGLYALRRADFRLLEAIALAGGAPSTIQKVFVIRTIPLEEELLPEYDRDPGVPVTDPLDPDRGPVDIESLIEDLDDTPNPGAPGALGDGRVLGQDSPAPIDIDSLTPAQAEPPVDVEEVNPRRTTTQAVEEGESFIYLEERGEWVKVQSGDSSPQSPEDMMLPDDADTMVLERIIEVPFKRLLQGDSKLNIVIRPNDRIFVAAPELGVVYIEGEVLRPGVYNLPVAGNGLTLKRLVAAAGGLGPLVAPERVDLTRMVGADREATIRVNLAAIYQRTEPDIYLKPDDHIKVGTSFIALPVAVIRNGFRATYGFGFLLDRNFGNDVFGAPPTNRSGF